MVVYAPFWFFTFFSLKAKIESLLTNVFVIFSGTCDQISYYHKTDEFNGGGPVVHMVDFLTNTPTQPQGRHWAGLCGKEPSEELELDDGWAPGLLRQHPWQCFV
jgi:hypothetical protein